ncbi:MAG TPA: ABC transporter permease [Spirochaetales bacterium]|nr:ABC transporter permease [Spirochaetales bacterium]HRY55151.1 ABC transporter permease [Spirochaetia bacterium]HRZ64570.1 ABC transporter permease [Spirochaetia bacterium]
MKPVSLWADAWKRLKKNKMALGGLVIVVTFIALCVLAPILPIYPYEEQVIAHQNLPPSLRPAGVTMIESRVGYLKLVMESEERTEMTDAEKAEIAAMEQDVSVNPAHKRVYIFGTDSLGRDMLSRILYGGRISILIGLVGTITALLVGIIVGAIAGYVGGWLDNVLMRFVDILYGLPYMLIVIIMMAIFGRNIINLFVAVALVSWLTLARVVRGQIISLKNAEFVEAARSMGASPGRIIFRHLTPNTLGVIVVFATLMVPSFIMNESFLSFLGLGVSAPLASWGSLVSEGANTMELYPWQLLAPAIAMTLFLFAMNFLGDGLRDALDPQSKNRL